MENFGIELVLSGCWLLIIQASCEKKIDQKHPGETNPCHLCDQLRHKLSTRHELKDIAEKNRPITNQAVWLARGVKEKSSTVFFEAQSWRQRCRKRPCSKKWSSVLKRRTRAAPFPEGSTPDQTVLCGNVQKNPQNLILGWEWAPAPGAGWEVKGGVLGDICRC